MNLASANRLDWNKLEQQINDNAVDQWRDRLAVCVREEGGHFEHTL